MSTPSGGDMTAAFSSALESASASASDASPASTPTPEVTPSAPATETATAAATAQPEGTEIPAAVSASEQAEEQPAKGEPPKWRWQDILANARETAAKEAAERARQEALQQYQWAQEFQPDEVQNVAQWARMLKSDPVAALRQLQSALEANPQYAAALKPQQAAETEPEPDLQLPDGTLVYSAPQLAKREAWRERQLEQKFAQQLQPFQQVAQSVQMERAQAQALSEVSSVLTKYTADPEFVKHKADVRELIANDRKLAALADADPDAALELAWSRVYREKVLPTKQRDSEAQMLANLQQRAVAGQSVNPNAPVASAPKTFKPGQQGFAEALSHFAAAGQ